MQVVDFYFDFSSTNSYFAADLERDAFMRLIDSEDVRDELKSVTGRAAERGVFGAPMFFVGDEMFWGKDRLDFVERWLTRPSV